MSLNIDRRRNNDIVHLCTDMNDFHAWEALNILQDSYHGKQVVEHARNNVKTNTFVFMQKDVTKMANAYVDELAQYIDVANKENKRILNSVDLI